MSLALDPATEQRIAERIQREIDRGHYQTPAEVIDHALSLLESEESWSPEEKADLERHLAGSLAEAQRGEVHTPEEVRTLLHQDRLQRANQLQ